VEAEELGDGRQDQVGVTDNPVAFVVAIFQLEVKRSPFCIGAPIAIPASHWLKGLVQYVSIATQKT
jgi:hypothetical protein